MNRNWGTLMSLYRRLKNTLGGMAIEYTLIASLIAIAAIASIHSVSGKVSNVMSSSGNLLN